MIFTRAHSHLANWLSLLAFFLPSSLRTSSTNTTHVHFSFSVSLLLPHRYKLETVSTQAAALWNGQTLNNRLVHCYRIRAIHPTTTSQNTSDLRCKSAHGFRHRGRLVWKVKSSKKRNYCLEMEKVSLYFRTVGSSTEAALTFRRCLTSGSLIMEMSQFKLVVALNSDWSLNADPHRHHLPAIR